MEIDFPTLFVAPKTLVVPMPWVEREPDCLVLIAHLDVDGVTVQGVRLKGTARKSLPDEVVTFQLEYHAPRGRGGAICRVEWRPLKGHNNKAMGPPEWRNHLISGCHLHGFDMNWTWAAKHVRRGNLPIAAPIVNPPTSYSDLLAFVGKEFRINGVEALDLPPWQLTLL